MEELDFDEVLRKAESTSTSARQKKSSKTKAIISAVVAAIFIGIAVFLMIVFVGKTDFSKDVPLSENVSRWTPMKWDYGDKSEASKVSLFGKEWSYVQKAQYYESGSCTLRFVNLSGSFGSSDEKSTESYTDEFKKGNPEWGGSSRTWFNISGQESRIEFVRSEYVSEGNETVNYYRSTPENGNLNMMVVSCSDEGEINKILPDKQGAELDGVSLKPSFLTVEF